MTFYGFVDSRDTTIRGVVSCNFVGSAFVADLTWREVGKGMIPP